MSINFNHVANTITASGSKGRLQDIGSGGASYQVFYSSATWTKPTAAVGVYVQCVGGGGGGAEGGIVDEFTDPSFSAAGGNGGDGGIVVSRFLVASSLTSTVAITVGAGGAGGQHVSPVLSGSASGVAGFDGGASSFGSYITTHKAKGGKGGNATINATTTANSTVYYGNQTPFTRGLYAGAGGYGQSINVNALTKSGQIAAFGPGGGGQGGTLPSGGYSSAVSNGGDGGDGGGENQNTGVLKLSVGTYNNGGYGGTGVNASGYGGGATLFYGGGGGGGGAGGFGGGSYISAGPGGYGGQPGGGGGGAGGMIYNSASGLVGSNNPGGQGGAGCVLVVTW